MKPSFWRDPGGLAGLAREIGPEDSAGTLERIEQSGFRPIEADGFEDMGRGWPRFLERLERTVTERAS